MALCDACFSFYIKSFQIFRIIKLAWRMFVFFIHLWNLGNISISLAPSGSFTAKNDNIHSFFHLHFSDLLIISFTGIQCFSLWRFVLANTSGIWSKRFTCVCSPLCQNLKIGCCFAANDIVQMCSVFCTCLLIARSVRLFSFLIKPKVYFLSLS